MDGSQMLSSWQKPSSLRTALTFPRNEEKTSMLIFTNFKTLLSLSLTSTFPSENSARREKCNTYVHSRAW
jgi:hypothetical protein